MQHPDEGTIHAWLDGELSGDEAASLESHISACPECSATVAEARGLIAASSRIVSALDVIPGDVIPSTRQPVRKNAWYSSVQVRAAAGILVVAGASLILMSRGQQDAARSTLVTEEAKQPVAETAAVAVTGGTAAATTPNKIQAPAAEAISRPRAVASKKMSSPQVTAPTPSAMAAPAPAPAPAPVTAQAMDEVAQAKALPLPQAGPRDARTMLSVTGARAREAEAGLKLVKSDTSQAAVRNVYELRQGVEVTLTETRLPVQRFSRGVSGQLQAVPPTAPSPAPVAANSADVPLSVITWVKGDKLFTLTGTVSKSELEAIKLKLPEEKR
jgi:hypothetical protein